LKEKSRAKQEEIGKNSPENFHKRNANRKELETCEIFLHASEKVIEKIESEVPEKPEQIMLPELFSGKGFAAHDRDPLHIFSDCAVVVTS
jgi:hypothetical protein